MEKITPNSELTKSKDLVAENIEKLKELFPEINTEGHIDFKVLKQLLGEEIEKEEEYYRMNWAGKSLTRMEAQKPSTGTLRPSSDNSLNWEQTQNLYLEGDNLEVLKILQKSYVGKIKLIYIDPPYNTGKDFIYEDNFGDNLGSYLSQTGQVDSKGIKLSTNIEGSGRFHSRWLNNLYSRLKLSRNLLKQDGVIMISLDDHEDYNMRKIANEIFGDENYLTTLIWNKQHSQQQGVFKKYHEYVLVYSRNSSLIKNISGGEGIIDAGALKKISRANPASEFTFPPGVRFDSSEDKVLTGTYGDSEKVTVVNGTLKCENGKTTEEVTLSAGWTQKDQMEKYFNGEEVYDTKGQKVLEFYFNSKGKLKCLKERSKITPSTLLPKYGMVSEQTAYLTKLMGKSVFDNPKPVQMISDFINWFCDEGDIVLDYFSGSGTTGDAVLRAKKNVKFILVQIPELVDVNSESGKQALSLGYTTITSLAQERLRRVSNEVEKETTEKDLGFRVFKLDSSNIKTWDGNPEELENNLFNAEDNIKEGRTAEDVLYEILLKYGLDLTLPIEVREIEGQKVFNVGHGALFVCLDEKIKAAVAEGIGKWKDEVDPEICRVIFRDAGFSDVDKTNATQTLKKFGITEVKSI